jgi:hypothetical protein
MKFLSFESMAYFLVAVAVAACAPTACLMSTQSRGGTAETAPTLAQFSGIPIPRGVAMDLESALIFAPGEGRSGRSVYTASLRTQDAFLIMAARFPTSAGRRARAFVRGSVSRPTYAARGR